MLESTDLPPILQSFGEDLANAMRIVPQQRARRGRQRAALGVVLATLAVTAAVLAVLLSGRGREVIPSAMASPLQRAARAALRQPSLFPRDDQYYYVRIEAARPTTMSVKVGPPVNAIETVVTDRWQSVTRAGLQRTRIIALSFSSTRDASRWAANAGAGAKAGAISSTALPPTGGKYAVPIGRGGELTRRQVLDLPTSPHALYSRLQPAETLPGYLRHASARTLAELRSEYGSIEGFRAWEDFHAITSAFTQDPMPPALRSGLFGALALIPGVKPDGSARDAVGRTGADIELTSRGIRTELIFDSATSALLGERQTVVGTGTGYPRGRIIENVAYLDEAVTDTLTIPQTSELR
jgi:hypothetical protein